MTFPRCPWYGACGGCSMQDVAYEEQLARKRKEAALLTGLPEESIAVHAGEPYGYRNRMDFVFGAGKIGQRRKGKWWEVVELDRCDISDARLNTILAEVNAAAGDMEPFDLKRRTGVFRNAVIRTTSLTGSVTFIVNREAPGLAAGEELVREFARSTSADNVLIGRVSAESGLSVSDDLAATKGEVFLRERICGREFEFHSQGFFQNNTVMAGRLVAYVSERLSQRKRGLLLDLYGGVGVFGICCSSHYDEVVTAEGHPGSAAGAVRNIEASGCGNVRAIEVDIKNIHLLNMPRHPDVILDPPRSGMIPKAIRRVLALDPAHIVYVSCNPKQFAAELPEFRGQGYDILSAALFDLFPQTPHMEMVYELGRRQGPHPPPPPRLRRARQPFS